MNAIRRAPILFAVPLCLLVAGVHGDAQVAGAPSRTVPLNIVTNMGTLPDNYAAKPAPILPPSPALVQTSPAPAVDFQGLYDDDTRRPPDTDGCVGPNHVVTMLNTQVRVQDRTGNTNNTTSLQNWWQSLISSAEGPFDPRIVYDPYSRRWIATAGDSPYIGSSALLVAGSTSSDPTGTWNAYRFSVVSNNWVADYPTVGFSRDKIVLSWNYYGIGISPQGVGLLVLNKTNLYNGGTVSPQWLFQAYHSGSTTNGLCITPSISYETNDATVYLLQDFQDNTNNSSYLALYSITGSAGSAILSRSTNFPSASAWWGTPSCGWCDIAPQLGLDVDINTVDSRMSEVVYRNGALWAAHTIFLPAHNPTRSAIQFWQIKTNGTVLQWGRLDDPTGINFYAFPSIAANRFGDALIGFSRFATNQYASANYAFHAFNEQEGTLESDYRYKSGESAYWKVNGDAFNRNRWGDYSMTCVDPVNDADFWTIQEYAAQYVPPLEDGSGRWGVWWANVRVSVPSNDFFTNAIALTGSDGSTDGTNVRGTQETGEPNHGGNGGGASIWYRWTAPVSGVVTIDTEESDFFTILAIYTGSSVGNLTLIGSDNGSVDGLGSRVVFNGTSGTTYRIAVDGENGDMGNVILNWVQPSAPFFITQPLSQTVYQNQNVTFTARAIGTPNPTYQWGFNGGNISGATQSAYTIANVQTNNAGNYTVVASSSSGTATSAVAVLRVIVSQATLSSAVYTNNQFKFTVSQVPDLRYAIQANTNLSTTNWTAFTTNVAPFTFTDNSATNYPMRFYRALYLP